MQSLIERLQKKYRNMSEKNRIIAVNVFGAFLVKGASLIVSLLTTPAYISFFHNESALGIWFTVLSVISWILNFDLGIGNGLRNYLTQSYTEHNKKESKALISSAYVSIGALCLILSALFFFAFGYINWNKAFSIKTDVISSKAMVKTVQIVFLGFILQMFFKIITSVLYAVQKSSVNNALTLITSILILFVIRIYPSRDNDFNIVFMAYLHAIAVLLPYIVASFLLFCNPRYRYMSPSFKAFNIHYSKKVLSLGGVFFVVQILYMMIMSTNEYFITLFSGSEYVVEYRVYNQLFTLGSTLFSLALTPIWSAITKAISEKDYSWIEKLYHRMILFAFGATGVELLIIPFIQIVINKWLGNNSFKVDYLVAINFSILGSLMIFNSVLSSIANGTGCLKIQAISFAVGSILKIPIAWGLVKLLHSWSGVVIATNIALLLYCIVQPFGIRRYLKNAQ